MSTNSATKEWKHDLILGYLALFLHFLTPSWLPMASARLNSAQHCDIILTKPTGWIHPPDFDNNGLYDSNTECEWLIMAPEFKEIEFQIHFVRTFSCPEDKLEVSFKVWPPSQIVKMVYCGVRGIQAPTQTTSNYLTVVFITDLYDNAEGFLLSYKETEGYQHKYRFKDVPVPGSITNVFTDDNRHYDNNIEILWSILVDRDKLILAKILYLDVEQYDSCKFDQLMILRLKKNHVFCGIGTKILLRSDMNVLHVGFVSDHSIHKSGFNMTFAPIDGGSGACGSVLTGPSDYLTSIDLDGDGRYDNELDCSWTISLDPDKVIVLKIEEMDIQKKTTECQADFLEVREAHKNKRKYCGSTPPPIFTTETNVLHIRFVSDESFSGVGFESIYLQAEDIWTCSSEYQCLLSDTVVDGNYLCDDFNDCPNGDDERFCEFRCPMECECFGLSVYCSDNGVCRTRNLTQNPSKTINLPSTTTFLDVSNNHRVYEKLKLEQTNLSFLIYLNISHCQIQGFHSNTFFSMRQLKTLDISFNKIGRLKTNLFSYQSVLETLILVGNSELITFETESFTGLVGLQYLTLSQLHIEQIYQNAFAKLTLKELKIYHSTIDAIQSNAFGSLRAEALYFNSSDIKEFSSSMFDGFQDVQIFKTDEYKFCCVKPETLREDGCFPKQDEFSSCDDLVRSDILIPLIWIIGFFSLLANVSSLVYRICSQKEQLKRSYGIFVSHLAVSDALMGAYLIIIAIVDAHYRGVYIYHDEYWRGSPWCQLAGILSILSNEASVLFICVITVDRLLVIKYPLGQVRVSQTASKIIAVFVWATALFIAVLPLALFDGKFYSQSGMCLALPLTRARPPGWSYSFGMSVGLNFVVCLLVGIGQWWMYTEIRASKRKMEGSRSGTRKDSRITRNLLFVVMTNVLCWLPIGVLGILASADNPIHGDVYSWIAVVVLPINSSVNPVLYTILAALQKREGPQHEDTVAHYIFTTDDVDKHTYLWHSRSFWQYPYQAEGYVALPDALEKDGLVPAQRLVIAKDLVQLLAKLHKLRFTQKNLHANDIFVTEHTKMCGNVAMVLRHKYSQKPSDYTENISALGLVLRQLVKET